MPDKKIETSNVKDVEIFRAGKWNGDVYTSQDLEQIENAYKKIGDKVKPYLKLGHSEEQKILQEDGYPAAGWIQNVRAIGDSLLCDIVNIPKKVKELIDAKAYGRFSPEIYWNYESGEGSFARVLRAVALLGGDTPACTTMQDFIDLYGEDSLVKIYIDDNKKNLHEYVTLIEEVPMEPEKTVEVVPEQTVAVQKDYTEELKAKDAIIETKENELAELKAYKERAEGEKLDLEIEAFIASNKDKITPAQAHLYTAMIKKDRFGIKTYAYKDGEKDVTVDNLDAFGLVKQVVSMSAPFVSYSEESQKTDVKLDPEDKLVMRAKELEKTGMKYSLALKHAAKEIQ